MKGRVSRGRRTNTVTLVFQVVGSTMRTCPMCKQEANHALLGPVSARLVMCGLCDEVYKP